MQAVPSWFSLDTLKIISARAAPKKASLLLVSILARLDLAMKRRCLRKKDWTVARTPHGPP
jgi:hypothetical protein